ncbi:hypothetical protein F444_22859 [Phytophthora nicotianae P1976]|uniref:Uncharacterized protein n=1 Tax=Phytophthora nicotianae P1976 TaxID=1317066 RepID=A0A080YWJ8_PHYNI|nr:hypothetical protein F444_22859 [Phytophthora nicotianae P1976]
MTQSPSRGTLYRVRAVSVSSGGLCRLWTTLSVQVGGGSVSASSGLAGDVVLSSGIASIGVATSAVDSLSDSACEALVGDGVPIPSDAGSQGSGAMPIVSGIFASDAT